MLTMGDSNISNSTLELRIFNGCSRDLARQKPNQLQPVEKSMADNAKTTCGRSTWKCSSDVSGNIMQYHHRQSIDHEQDHEQNHAEYRYDIYIYI